MDRYFALAVVAVLLPAAAAVGEEASFVIVQPGYPGSTSLAEAFIYDLSSALTKGGGPASLKGAYHNEVKAALKAIGDDKPQFGIVSLGFYLAHREDLKLQAILASRPSVSFFLATKKGQPVAPKDLAGLVVTGTPFQEMDLVERIIFGAGAGGCPVKPSELSGSGAKPVPVDPTRPAVEVRKWKIEATEGFSKGLRAVKGDKARAALLTELERRSMEGMPSADGIEVCYRTEELPVALLVSFGPPTEAAKKGAGALESLGKSAEGKELLRIMGIQGFSAMDAKKLKELEGRYGSAPPAPIGGGEKTAER